MVINLIIAFIFSPQHDILFDDLTAREHVELFAGLKGVESKHIAKLVETRLKAVRLWNVVDKRSGTYSGGYRFTNYL